MLLAFGDLTGYMVRMGYNWGNFVWLKKKVGGKTREIREKSRERVERERNEWEIEERKRRERKKDAKR